MSQRIGILGGTFNPIHNGHLAVAEEALGRLRLDRVLFIPSFLPPHKSGGDMPSADERQEMVRLAIAGSPQFRLSNIEARRGGRSYTIDTIEELRATHPGAELFFLTGLDSFLDLRTWKDWQRLLSLCTFVVLSRRGSRFRDIRAMGIAGFSESVLNLLDAGELDQVAAGCGGVRLHLLRIPFVDISSTDIRSRVRSGRSIKYLLPEAVEGYIIDHKFYG